MYFRLNPECYLIRGIRNGAIIDLIDNKIYALDENEALLLTLCEKNNLIRGNEELLNELKQLCLGNFYPKNVYIQKLRAGSITKGNQKDQPPELFRAFIEINNKCNRECWFCGYYGIKRSSGCIGCNKWNDDGEDLTIMRLKELLDELKDLDCKDIYIIGGDLTLDWNRTMEILEHANKKFVNLFITLHEQSLSKDIIDDLENKAKLIIQTDNLKNRNFHNFITLLSIKPEDWMSADIIEDENIIIDFIIDSENSLIADIPIMSKKKIQAIDMHDFLNNIEYHPCLGHTLAISYTGNILPCPMMRNHVLGNINNKALYSIFDEKINDIDKFWNLTLDKIDKCTKCEFRYICIDCRCLEEKLTGKLDGKRICSYDPEIGKWL